MVNYADFEKLSYIIEHSLQGFIANEPAKRRREAGEAAALLPDFKP